MIVFFIIGLILIADPALIFSVFSESALIFLFVAQFVVYFLGAMLFTHKVNPMPGANVAIRVHCSAMIAFALINILLLIIGMASL